MNYPDWCQEAVAHLQSREDAVVVIDGGTCKSASVLRNIVLCAAADAGVGASLGNVLVTCGLGDHDPSELAAYGDRLKAIRP